MLKSTTGRIILGKVVVEGVPFRKTYRQVNKIESAEHYVCNGIRSRSIDNLDYVVVPA
jgi:hypothetical protein